MSKSRILLDEQSFLIYSKLMEKQEAEKTANPQQAEHYHQVKTLLEWDAPGRPFKKRSRTYYSAILVIMFFVLVILFLFSQYMLMLVVVSLVFLAFAFASVPPHNFHFRISSEGVFIEDHFTLWQELYDFYITKQNDQQIAALRTQSFYPGEIYLNPGDGVTVEKIKTALLPYLPYREYIKPTFVDRASNWMSKNFPLEPIPQKNKPLGKVSRL